jgi:hypothetical protein
MGLLSPQPSKGKDKPTNNEAVAFAADGLKTFIKQAYTTDLGVLAVWPERTNYPQV